MPLPAWIAPDQAKIIAEADVTPNLLFSTVIEGKTDEERLAEIVAGHIEAQCAHVWGEARKATGSLSLPPTVAQFKISMPFEAPEGFEGDELADLETDYNDDIALRIETLKEATMLTVKEFVIAKLLYGATHDEDIQARAKTHWINAQTALRSLKSQLLKIRSLYLMATRDPLS